MPCCDNPDIDSTTFLPPPVPGDGCLRVRYTCICPADESQWVLDVANTDCVDNALCTGQLSCTPLECVIEQFNACDIGQPLPALPIPFCDPSCCETTTTTLPPTSTTTTIPPLDQYCVCGYESTYDCNTTTWGAVTLAGCTVEGAPVDIGWAISVGDDCLAQYTQSSDMDICVGQCNVNDNCGQALPDPPAIPPGPTCCPSTTTTPPPDLYCNCNYFSVYDCDTQTWSSVSLDFPGCDVGTDPVTYGWEISPNDDCFAIKGTFVPLSECGTEEDCLNAEISCQDIPAPPDGLLPGPLCCP